MAELGRLKTEREPHVGRARGGVMREELRKKRGPKLKLHEEH